MGGEVEGSLHGCREDGVVVVAVAAAARSIAAPESIVADRSLAAPEPTLSGGAGKDGPPGSGGGGAGLEVGEGGWLGFGAGVGVGIGLGWGVGVGDGEVEVLEEAGEEAVGAGCVFGEDLEAGGDGAEVGVGDDVFDDILLLGG